MTLNHKHQAMSDSTTYHHHRSHDYRRSITQFVFAHQFILTSLWTVGFLLIFIWQRSAVDRVLEYRRWAIPSRPIPKLRSLVLDLRDFGAVGDGYTLNTPAFEKAIREIKRRGGGQLNVPPGKWLTAPFNLTSHMTLFLAQNSVILGVDVSTLFAFRLFGICNVGICNVFKIVCDCRVVLQLDEVDHNV